jgi:hypothetical protein
MKKEFQAANHPFALAIDGACLFSVFICAIREIRG